jgi:hypothetical protein
MHRAGPFDLRQWRHIDWLQRHSALRARARALLPDLGVHRAGVLALLVRGADGLAKAIRCEKPLGILFEPRQAAVAAEVVGLPFVVDVPNCVVWRNGHSANGIEYLGRGNGGVFVRTG